MMGMATVDSLLIRTAGSLPVASLHQPYPDEDRTSWCVLGVAAVLRNLERFLCSGGVTKFQPQRPKGHCCPWGVIKVAVVNRFLERCCGLCESLVMIHLRLRSALRHLHNSRHRDRSFIVMYEPADVANTAKQHNFSTPPIP